MYTKLKEVIVRTLSRRPDSLRESVRIAFTLTPAGEEEHIHPYDPLARDVANFHANGEDSIKTCLCREIQFAKYGANNKAPVHYGDTSPMVQSRGDVITLDNHWSGPIPNANLAPIMAVNNSGSEQKLGILWRMAYHPLDNGHSITVPCSWKLQAYIVSNEIHNDSILKPEDRRQAIFSTPINWDALPLSSVWMLCQDADGVIRLKNDEYSHLGYPPTAPAEEPAGDRTQFSQVLERLAALEESITHIREDVASGQRAIAGVQDQLSALGESVKTDVSRLNRSLTAIETRTAKLAESFDQSQTRLSAAQTATSSVQQLMTGLNKANDQLADLNRRVPAVESRYEKVAIALTRYDDRIDGVEKSANQTRDQVALVQQLAVSTNGHLMALAKQSPGAPAPDLAPAPAIESQAEKLEKSLVQTQKQLVSVLNAVYILDRRIPAVESKADKLEIALKQFEGQTQSDLVTIQVLLTGLDRRVTAMEARSGDMDFGGDVQDGEHLDGGPPFTFPSYPAESPPPAGIPLL